MPDDLFSFIGVADAICITTNGYVTKGGRAVMGRGCAREAKERWPGIDLALGNAIRKNGNITQVIGFSKNSYIVALPVKPASRIISDPQKEVVSHMAGRFKKGERVPGWALKADLNIIKESIKQLIELADTFEWKKVVLPRPGCGAGELDWKDIEGILKELDSRFIVVSKSAPILRRR